MTDERKGGLSRRQTLECMLWAGTGVVWTVAGGVPSSRLIGAAKAAEGSFSFVQISDSHIGFEKPANPDARATLERCGRQGSGDAGQARLHHPHRGHQPHGEGERIRRRAATDRPDEARRPLRARRTRHPRSEDARRLSRALRQGRDRRRLVRFRPGRRAFCVAQQCRRPQEERPRLAGPRAARVARGRSQGEDGFDADRHLLPHPALDDRARMGLGHRGFGAGAWLSRRASAR